MGSLEFVARHDHARNPEENDVRAGHEIVGRIKVFLFRRIFGPAHDRERPEPGAEPCVEHVFILTPSVALRRIHAHIDFVPVIIPRRNAVPPPDLAADAPVLDVFHPVEISLGPTLRIEFDRAVADRLDCGFGEFVHFDEPLFAEHGLDRHAPALRVADRMNEIFYFVKQSELFHVRHNLFAAFKTVHAFVFACAFIHLRILCEHVDEVKIMAQTDLEVVRVVCGSDLYAAGSFFGIGMLVFNDRNFTVRERKIDSFSDKVLISGIADRHRDRGISEHGFRTGCGNDQKAGTIGQRIFEVIELAVFLLVDDFLIGERRFGNGAPVDHALAAFDISLVVQLYKDLFDGVAEPFVHGETLALPVAGCAEFAELPDDGSAILLAPCPDPFDELLPSEFVASGSLFFAEIFFDAAFGCDAGVVGSGEPADFIAFHSVPARENILKRIVENMPHGQDAGHVRRGDHDGIRFFIGIGLAVEKAVVFPVGIPFFLDGRGFVCFRHL